jgi:hypothetical protein
MTKELILILASIEIFINFKMIMDQSIIRAFD